MESTHGASGKFARIIVFILVLALLLCACQPGRLVGKYPRSDVVIEGGVSVTRTVYVLVYEGCATVDGQEKCTQYEREVSREAYDRASP